MKSLDEMCMREVKELAIQYEAVKESFIDAHPYIGRFVVVRTFSAGVHFGTLGWAYEKQALLNNSKRLWQWSGAFTLSAVSQRGVTSAKVSCAVPEMYFSEAIEIIPCSPEAEKNLAGLKEHTP